MSNLHQELWTAFNDISFDEKHHKYTDTKGTIYKSATGWIQQFFPDKDWNQIALKAAKKRIIKEKGTDYVPTDDELSAMATALQAEWKKSGDYACALGTEVHLVMENLWAKKDYRFNESLTEKFPDMKADFDYRKMRGQELFNKLKQTYAPIANEFIVYDQPNGICGTIDMIAYNMKTGKYAIFDWKTSKNFDVGNSFGEYLKAPFDYVEACNTAEYSLQLSLYKYMLEQKTSMKIDDLILFQLPGKEKGMPLVHRCYDFSERIAALLKKE